MKCTIQGMLVGGLMLSVSALNAQPPQAPQQQPQTQQSPQPFQQAQPKPQPKQNVVASVNGDVITKKQLETTVQSKLQGKQIDPPMVEKVRKQALDSLIEGLLIEQHVAKNGPEVKTEEVESVISRVKQQLASQMVDFDQYLASRGHTQKSFKKRIKGSLGWRKFQQEKLKPENLQAFFKKNPDKFQAENYEEAQQQVAQVYMATLWEDIISQQKPKAEIKIVEKNAPKPQQKRQPAPPNAFPK